LSIQEIIDKISIACHKYGIRITDYFKDYDKIKSGIITERQMFSCLSLSVEKSANLSSNEMEQLVTYYKKFDGRCDYKSFCETIENAFTIPDMEKKPLASVNRPPNGLLAKVF
jgi:Ca2+-binding EF-hand superfamily protein